MTRKSRSLKLYRAMLRLLPPRLRDRHGAEMEELFADRLAEARCAGRAAGLLTWIVAVGDIAGAWPREYRVRDRRRKRAGLRREERPIMVGSDIRYAFRSLARQKGATVLVASMLALGMAANVTVFSLVNGLFLRPFPRPSRRIRR